MRSTLAMADEGARSDVKREVAATRQQTNFEEPKESRTAVEDVVEGEVSDYDTEGRQMQ